MVRGPNELAAGCEDPVHDSIRPRSAGISQVGERPRRVHEHILGQNDLVVLPASQVPDGGFSAIVFSEGTRIHERNRQRPRLFCHRPHGGRDNLHRRAWVQLHPAGPMVDRSGPDVTSPASPSWPCPAARRPCIWPCACWVGRGSRVFARPDLRQRISPVVHQGGELVSASTGKAGAWIRNCWRLTRADREPVACRGRAHGPYKCGTWTASRPL